MCVGYSNSFSEGHNVVVLYPVVNQHPVPVREFDTSDRQVVSPPQRSGEVECVTICETMCSTRMN